MYVAQFVNFQRTGKGYLQFSAGMWEGKAKLTMIFCARVSRESASYFRVIGPRKNNTSTNEANKEGSLKE